MIFLDTNILIDAAHGDKIAQRFIQSSEAIGQIGISAITQMELLVGARNKEELNEIIKFTRRFSVAPLDFAITQEAVQLLTMYRLRFGLTIADALIAVTAKVAKAPFATKNRKDFYFIDGLQLANYL